MIITNYGSTSSGKSTFCASMAMAIMKANPRATVLIINFSTDVPMHPIWNTSTIIPRAYSLGTVFEDEIITQKSLTKCIVTLENNKNVGLLGYCLGDSPLSYKDVEYKQVIDLLKAAEQLVDYVIVDCGANLLKDETAASIEMANCLNIFLDPDPNGIVYLKTARLMYENNPKFMVGNTNYIIGPCRSFNAVKEMKNSLNIKAYEMPYSSEIAVKGCEGRIFDIYKSAPRRYKNIIKKVLSSTNNADNTSRQNINFVIEDEEDKTQGKNNRELEE